MSDDYAAFRMALISEILEAGLDPKQVAEKLWAHRNAHPSGGKVADLGEIAAYEAAGHDWKAVKPHA